MSNIAKSGPYGNENAPINWNLELAKDQTITEVAVYHGSVVEGLGFVLVDGRGKTITRQFGSNAGKPDKFALKKNEYITHISGTHAEYQGDSYQRTIALLKIHTNLNQDGFGPYGLRKGARKAVDFTSNVGVVVGFFGAATKFLDSIGVYVKFEDEEELVAEGATGEGYKKEPKPSTKDDDQESDGELPEPVEAPRRKPEPSKETESDGKHPKVDESDKKPQPQKDEESDGELPEEVNNPKKKPQPETGEESDGELPEQVEPPKRKPKEDGQLPEVVEPPIGKPKEDGQLSQAVESKGELEEDGELPEVIEADAEEEGQLPEAVEPRRKRMLSNGDYYFDIVLKTRTRFQNIVLDDEAAHKREFKFPLRGQAPPPPPFVPQDSSTHANRVFRQVGVHVSDGVFDDQNWLVITATGGGYPPTNTYSLVYYGGRLESDVVYVYGCPVRIPFNKDALFRCSYEGAFRVAYVEGIGYKFVMVYSQ